jgi:replicative DNA helicase
MEKILRSLSKEHFPDPVLADMFTLIDRYALKTGSVLTQSVVHDLMRKTADEGRLAHLGETYDLLAEANITDAEFDWSVSELQDRLAERQTQQALTEAMEILTVGKPTGKEGEIVLGHEAARENLMTSMSVIEKELHIQDSPEGDIREEESDVLAEYAERKRLLKEGMHQGVNFGIESLDDKLGGLQRGELVLSVGYSSDGKTTLCTQLAWSAAVEQNKNVVFFTTETTRDTVRRKLISRHSKLPKFELDEGINTRDIKAGTLTEAQEIRYAEVVRDLARNEDYGKLHVSQVPRGATLSAIEAQLYRLQRQFDIDLVVLDYLSLIRPAARRDSDREALSGILKESKQLSTTFNGGKGIPFVSPWQVNRQARDEASKLGYYTSRALAETAEATNSADVIISILRDENQDSRYADLKGQILKNRDGETAASLIYKVDYATSHFQSQNVSASLANVVSYGGNSSSTSGDAFAGLLG